MNSNGRERVLIDHISYLFHVVLLHNHGPLIILTTQNLIVPFGFYHLLHGPNELRYDHVAHSLEKRMCLLITFPTCSIHIVSWKRPSTVTCEKGLQEYQIKCTREGLFWALCIASILKSCMSMKAARHSSAWDIHAMLVHTKYLAHTLLNIP